MCFHFSYTVQVDTIKKFSQLIMLVSVYTPWNSENKITYSAQVRLIVFYSKKQFLFNE